MNRLKRIKWWVENLFRKAVRKKSLDEEHVERMTYLHELLYVPAQARLKPSKTRTYFNQLVDDFTVSSVTCAKIDGSIIASSKQDAFSDAIKGSSLYEFILSEEPSTNFVLLKGGDKVKALFPSNGNLFLVEATGNITPVEVKALAEQARKGLEAG